VEADPRDVTDRPKEGEREKYGGKRKRNGKKKNQGESEKLEGRKKEVSRVKESLGEWRFPLHASQLARFQMDG